MTVGHLILALAAQWRRMVAWVLLAAAGGSAIALLLPPTYDASVTFYPAQTGGLQLPASLANLASQVGIVGGGNAGAESPIFYANLARSASVLNTVLADSFRTRDSTVGPRPLLELLGIRGTSAAQRTSDGKRALLRMIDASVLSPTNVVALKVSSRDPVLSAGIASDLMHQVTRFTTEKLSSQAHAKRVFAQSREEWARGQLRSAEEAVRDFLSRNREFQRSPTLRLRYDGLQRRVQLAQDLYVAISRELEQARLQEVNDIPVLTVIDTAEVPVRRSRPHRAPIVLTIVGITALVAVFGVAAREVIAARIAQGDHELESILNWWRQSTDGSLLRRVLRRGRRAGKRRSRSVSTPRPRATRTARSPPTPGSSATGRPAAARRPATPTQAREASRPS